MRQVEDDQVKSFITKKLESVTLPRTVPRSVCDLASQCRNLTYVFYAPLKTLQTTESFIRNRFSINSCVEN
jgi:hypothetical protein